MRVGEPLLHIIRNIVMIVFISILAGALSVTALIAYTMRNHMITAIKIDAPFEKVCSKIGEALTSVPGWGHPLPDWDFHETVAKTHYFENLSKKKIFFVCKAEYANRIVDRFHHMGAMMPCAWALYETMSGEVYISKMNIGLMSKMFFGNIIGTTMGKVAREEKLILNKLQQLLKES